MTKFQNNIVIQAGWSVDNVNGEYFIPQTHYVYLTYICSRYEEVVLISPTKSKFSNDANKVKIDFSNIRILELPYYKTFLGSIKHFFSFYKSIKSLPEYKRFYCRVPDPFSWLPKLLFGKNCIIHFVGDGFESIWSNQFTSTFKKVIHTFAYLPDFILTVFSCYRSKVYTNGNHIAKRLLKFGVKATPLISSTLLEDDFQLIQRNKSKTLNLLFLGYLSAHKGIKTILELIDILEQNKVDYHFNIIGDGVMKEFVLNYIIAKRIEDKVTLFGHLNDRVLINQIIDKSDLFVFPSNSEGSPRVILEVMARNLPVISTPVGSLPYCFHDQIHIIYADFNNPKSFYDKILWASENKDLVNTLSVNAYNKVKQNYTMNKFLSQIFN